MDPNLRCRLLAETLRDILQKGMILSSRTVHYIDSTYAFLPVAALAERMYHTTESETETLFSLLFFPDLSTQIQIEPILAEADFRKMDESAIVEYLIRMRPQATFYFPDHRGSLTINAPESAIESFVMRLKLSKKLHPRLIDASRRYIPDKDRMRIRVMLRNARFCQTENRVAFLCTFFEAFPDAEDGHFNFIIDLFDE